MNPSYSTPFSPFTNLALVSFWIACCMSSVSSVTLTTAMLEHLRTCSTNMGLKMYVNIEKDMYIFNNYIHKYTTLWFCDNDHKSGLIMTTKLKYEVRTSQYGIHSS